MTTVSAESGSGVEYALASTAGFDTLDPASNLCLIRT